MTTPAEGLTDVQLLDRTRAGDDAAFDELRRRYRSDGLRAARIVAHDQDEADQIAEDTFESLHAVLAAGHGPRTAVSPQLRTMIRRHALDAHRVADDTHEALDPAAVEDLPRVPDPLADVEARNLIREAFDSLPERWQRVLWFTEVEARPANALVPDLSSAASAVAALAYRAREGLRQAYLAVHMSVAVAADCQPIVPKLPAYIREALSPEDDVTVAIHLDTCMDCRNRRYELLLLVSNLRSVLAPALLGHRAGTPAATRPVAARATAALAAGGAAGRAARTSALAAMTAVGQLPRRLIKVAATAAVAILAAVALTWAASSAFAPTPSADAASGDLVRNDSPAVQFEESSNSVDTSEQAPPAVTMDPLGLLAGLPVGEDDATTDEAGPSEPNAGDNVGQPATTSGRPQASHTQNNTSGNDTNASNDQSDDQPSGPEPTDSTTSDSAGGGAAAGAPGGGSPGGSQPPSNPDPGEEPAPPTGGGGSDEPTDPVDAPDEEDEDEPGLLERVLCLLLC